MMGKWEEAREALRASQVMDGALDWPRSLLEHQFSGSGEPLKVCDKGSDLISHLSGE